MVVPAELLTVGYAEPIRRWLRERFASVQLIMFERLQFEDALEDVVLLLAHGTGGCDAFSLYHVHSAEDLDRFQQIDGFPVALNESGKWTELLLTVQQRQTFRRVAKRHFVDLGSYGSVELGTVTGSNDFFTLNEATRCQHSLLEGMHVRPISPPGTRHLRGVSFTQAHWEELRAQGAPVWLLHPDADDNHDGLLRYLAKGVAAGVDTAYKCQMRKPWWRPPLVAAPDLFFTYMSHFYPRLISNEARVSFVNSMHGVRLTHDVPDVTREALPILALNSLTLLGAEVFGRSYGGGILKMEPREAASLPVPKPAVLVEVWKRVGPERSKLIRLLEDGKWGDVVSRIDDVLLGDVLGLEADEAPSLYDATMALRSRRMGRALADGQESYATDSLALDNGQA
jgi:adenine-specific DNA-methyltransferase